MATTPTKSNLTHLMDLAAAARTQREKAPMTGVKGDLRIPQKDIIARFLGEQGGKNNVAGEWHFLFIPSAKLKQYASRGYEPVIENGEMVVYQSDVLMKIPTKFYTEELAATKADSDRVTRNKVLKTTKTAIGTEQASAVHTGPDADREALESEH